MPVSLRFQVAVRDEHRHHAPVTQKERNREAECYRIRQFVGQDFRTGKLLCFQQLGYRGTTPLPDCCLLDSSATAAWYSLSSCRRSSSARLDLHSGAYERQRCTVLFRLRRNAWQGSQSSIWRSICSHTASSTSPSM